MKEKLSFKELVFVASMLFGLFFGAGNIIFPVHLGQAAGSNVWQAIAGFILTGVGIPILAVAAIGMSGGNGLQDLAKRVGGKYSMVFTCMLYLTIGPFFAIPRCATVPFAMGVEPLLADTSSFMPLLIFTVIFFAIVMFFSLRPSGIMVWIGKILNPIFLVFLGVMLFVSFIWPLGSVEAILPAADYTEGAMAKGLLEGYNTLDALAGLAFGIIVVNSVRGLGLTQPKAIAANTIKAGVLSGVLMAVIYIMITLMGTMSRGEFELSANGSIALANISGYYFGTEGTLILAGISTFACLKTAIGLVTSCSETFTVLFPKGPSYRVWATIFGVFSMCVANVGLTAIITYAIPVLMFLYPLTITLTLLGLTGNWFNHDKNVYGFVTLFTVIAAFFDLLNALPAEFTTSEGVQSLLSYAAMYLPFFNLGFGWVVPAIIGFVIGLAKYCARTGSVVQ